MKKPAILMLAAAFLLSACSGEEKTQEVSVTTAPSPETAVEETAPQPEVEEKGSQPEAGDTAPRQEAEGTGQSREEETAPALEKEVKDHLPVAFHVTTNYRSISDEDQDTGETMLYCSAPDMHITNEGYEALAGAVDDYWDNVWSNVTDSYNEMRSDAREYHESEYHYEYYELSHTGELVRGDDTVFSFFDNEYCYFGGAHPNSYSHGVNFDARSGRLLTLRDVTADYDKLYSGVLKQLADMNSEYGGSMLFDGYESTVEEMFYGDDALEWLLKPNGVLIYFNQYAIAPYAAGIQNVFFPFSQYPGLFKEEYIHTGGMICPLPWDGLQMDVNGDGAEDDVCLSWEDDPEAYTSKITISVNGSETSCTEYGSYYRAWVLQDADGNGWCYVELTQDNDWTLIDVFDLTGRLPSFAGEMSGMSMSEPVTSPENFAMTVHIDLLGTYFSTRDYHLGEDGMPEGNVGYFTLSGCGPDGYMTSVRELPAVLYETMDGPEGEKTTLPAGTRFYPRRTDGESWVMMELEDGSFCRIDLEKEDYLHTIDGVSEYDCFEQIYYAG